MNEKVELHSIKFFQPRQHSIRCMCYNVLTSQLAVSRSDSSIELWDFKSLPYLEKVIPADSLISIETLTWFQGVLLSAGLEGYIIEHDLKKLTAKSKLSVIGCAPIWCMKVSNNGKYLAVGNDDGHVVLHEFHCKELTFLLKFKKQEGSILCLDWHKSDEKIVTGSLDVIRVWDVETGCVLNRIILGRAARDKQTAVWCISVLSDMTIVSGDSCGKTSFWDGNTGSLISQSNSLKDCKADILTLIVNKDETEIYSSGVDPVLTMFQKSESSALWIRSVEKVIHSHDVRCLTFADNSIVSGGDDCKLHVRKLSPQSVTKYSSLCQRTRNATVLAKEAGCLLMNYTDHLTIAKLYSAEKDGFKILIKMSPKEGERIISCSISNNGKWVAYSTLNHLNLYAMSLEWPSKQLPSAKKVVLPKTDIISHPITQMLFSTNSTYLIFYTGHSICIIKCDVEQPLIESIIEDDSDYIQKIELMEISPNNSYLACGSSNGKIIVYNMQTLKIHCKLPAHEFRPTALKFDPASENLVAVYNNREIVEYSLVHLKYTDWCKSSEVGSSLQNTNCPITSIVFHNSLVIFQDENFIYSFRRELTNQQRKRKDSNDSPLPVKKLYSKKALGKLSNFTSCANGVLSVTIPEKQLDECLPPPIWKKKFGT